MPTYEYACTVCGDHFDRVQSFVEDPLTVCDICGGRLRRVFHAAGLLFKGSGFYSTDSKSGAKPAARANGSRDSKGASTGDSGDRSTSASISESKTGSTGESKGESKGSRSSPAPAKENS
ncbi:MAG TPA: FmdB family zinc ribbon protein [Actinomycetota bacterium]|nr:FmdB family zinc ribbon protein [Actinomycetota bacterium]